MSKFKTVLMNRRRSLIKYSPELLIGIGISGMIASTILAVEATPKALYLIDAKKEELETDELSVKETVKAAWKPYIPALITCGVSIGCVICGTAKHVKRNTALTAAYSLSQRAISEYRDKVIETIGEKKEKDIRDSINENRIKNNPPNSTNVIFGTIGMTLCYDSTSARYFNSDMETIRRALNNINRILMDEMSVSLSEFYDEIGLEHTSISDEIGWNIDDKLVDITFSSHIADDGRPCLVIDFNNDPKYNYHQLY